MLDIEYLKELFITERGFRQKAKSWCLKNHPGLYNDIMKELPEFDDFQDKIWCLVKGVRCCEVCSKPIGWARRGKVYCSQECAKKARRTLTAEKMKKTSLERYGFENPASAPEIQAKFRKTNLEKYGSISPFGSKEVNEKSKQTMQERYGVNNAASIPSAIQKRKERNLERYGVECPAQCEEVKKKMRQTCLERYGVDNYFKTDEIKRQTSERWKERGAEIFDKIKKTNLERYGVEYPLQSKEIRDKCKYTVYQKYGVDNIFKLPSTWDKIRETCLTKYGVPHHNQSEILKQRHKQKRYDYLKSIGIEQTVGIMMGPTKYGMVSDACLIAQSNGTVTVEMLKQEFADYHNAMRHLGILRTGNITSPHQIILDFLDENNIEYITNTRSVIKPKELDIWIPEHKVGIEVNGLYWHKSDNYTDRHLVKFDLARQHNIKLLQFTDADILDRVEIVKSMILSKLGLLSNRIMARKCRIISVPRHIAIEFLERCHYQKRTTNAAKHIGLVNNDKLVAIIGYTMKGKECRIERFACELNTNVVGGYSKLEREITRQENVNRFVTFSLGLISDGSLYSMNGYETKCYSKHAEWYVTDTKQLYNRQQFMKYKLKDKFGGGYNPNKTERENIIANGYWLYFGAGITKWVKEL